MNIELTPTEKQQLKNLARGYHGKALFAYLSKLLASISNIDNVNENNLQAYKVAKEIISVHLYDLLSSLKRDEVKEEFGEYE